MRTWQSSLRIEPYKLKHKTMLTFSRKHVETKCAKVPIARKAQSSHYFASATRQETSIALSAASWETVAANIIEP